MKATIITGVAAAVLLTAAAVPEPRASVGHVDSAKVHLRVVRDSIALYRARYGVWPKRLEMLAQKHVAILDRVPVDPWGRAFVWIRPGKATSSGCLLSHGPDGEIGTEDDLTDICDLGVLNQHLVLMAGVESKSGGRDAYGRPIRLIDRDGHRLAWSYGADGRPDTEDDVMARMRKN